MSQYTQEVVSGQRFEFGKNWSRFLELVNEERIAEAEHSLMEKLDMESLQGKSFLDIGSGSGLFSLAARRLGASVHSFDYDPHSVACTAQLKQRYFSEDEKWQVEQGSVLDTSYLTSFKAFDIVYSWGVLHHTGAMWQALDNVSSLVAQQGHLFIAIYDEQPFLSHYWQFVKKLYNRHPILRVLVIAMHLPYLGMILLVKTLLGRLTLQRGMSYWYDYIDWVGGYPFEVAKPEEIFSFFRQRGFTLKHLKTCSGKGGCNEFVFEKAM